MMTPTLTSPTLFTTSLRASSFTLLWGEYERVPGEARTDLSASLTGPYSSAPLVVPGLGSISASNEGWPWTTISFSFPDASDGYYSFYVRHWNGVAMSAAERVTVRLHSSTGGPGPVTTMLQQQAGPVSGANFALDAEYAYARGSNNLFQIINLATGDVTDLTAQITSQLGLGTTTGSFTTLNTKLHTVGNLVIGRTIQHGPPEGSTTWAYDKTTGQFSTLPGLGGTSLSEAVSGIFGISEDLSTVWIRESANNLRMISGGGNVGLTSPGQRDSHKIWELDGDIYVPYLTTPASPNYRLARLNGLTGTTVYTKRWSDHLPGLVPSDRVHILGIYNHRLVVYANAQIWLVDTATFAATPIAGVAGTPGNTDGPADEALISDPGPNATVIGDTLYWVQATGTLLSFRQLKLTTPPLPPGEPNNLEPPSAPAEFGDPIPTSTTGYFVDINEDTAFQVDLYTYDPELPTGAGANYSFRVFGPTGSGGSTPAPGSPPIQQYVRTRFGRVMIKQAATGHSELPTYPEPESDDDDYVPATAVARLFYEPDDNASGIWETEIIDEETGEKGWSGTPFTGEGDFFIADVIETATGRVSNTTWFVVSVHPVYDPPSVPRFAEGQSLHTKEDTPKTATFVIDYPGDSETGDDASEPPFTADELRVDIHSAADASHETEGWDGSVTVYDDGDPMVVAGVVTINQRIVSKETLQFTATFVPAANWNGTTSFAIRSYDGGEGDAQGVSGIGTVTIFVQPVNDPPSAPVTASTLTYNEDEVAELVYTWTDAEFDSENPRPGNTIEISVDGGHTWDQAWYDAHGGRWDVVDDSTEDFTAKVRYVPKRNWAGTATIKVRALDPDKGVSSVTTTTLTYSGVADRPSAPAPSHMPTVKKSKVSTQTFTSVDPDGDTLTFEVRPVGGTWGSTANLGAEVGTVAITATNSPQCTVTFTPHTNFTGQYLFEIRAFDGSEYSLATLVRGLVNAEAIQMDLQRVIHTENSGSTIESLGPIPAWNIRIRPATAGWGTATMVLSAAAIGRRADDLGLTVDEMLWPWHVECVLTYEGLPRFVGPIMEWDYTADGLGIQATFEGLGAYLDGILIEGGASYVGAEQSAIIWDLVSAAQARDYGDYLLSDATTDTGESRVISWEQNTTIGRAISDIYGLDNPPEVWVTPAREVSTATRRGSDKAGSILFTNGNCVDIQVGGRERTTATVAAVVGDSHNAVAEGATAMLEKVGRIGAGVQAPFLTTQGDVDNAAADIVAQRAQPLVTAKFTHVINQRSLIRPFSYDVGDVVSIEFTTRSKRVRKKVRIMQLEIRPSDHSSHDFEVEVVAEEVPPSGTPHLSRGGHRPRDWDRIVDLMRRV